MHGGTNRDHKITLLGIFLFFGKGAHIILLFYFKDLKWDTGWTLLSQNNPLLFMFSVSFCSKGLFKTFSYWFMLKETKYKVPTMQVVVASCLLFMNCNVCARPLLNFISNTSCSFVSFLCKYFCYNFFKEYITNKLIHFSSM